MKYRKFGNTDLIVSEVGFGAWAIGGNAIVGNTPIGWGKADDKDSNAAIMQAVEQGINFFDTADFYGLGHSETLLGNALGNNKEIIIATKVGHRNINNTIKLDYSKAYILDACEMSLKRLKRETIDYYQLHSAKLAHLQSGECIEAMQLLQQQGKIRYWGISLNTFNPAPEAGFLCEHQLGQGFQLVFNIINQRATGIMKLAREQGYGVIARMPLQFGLLTGKLKSDAKFAPDDHRSFRFTRDILETSLATLENTIWPLCQKYGISKTALALSFILSYDEMSTVIPGIRTSFHAIDNTSGIIQLNKEDIILIETAYTDHFAYVVDLMEQQG
jgi:aryl-alcohol dehydrogenase-like predicted oxidoreductase